MDNEQWIIDLPDEHKLGRNELNGAYAIRPPFSKLFVEKIIVNFL